MIIEEAHGCASGILSRGRRYGFRNAINPQRAGMEAIDVRDLLKE